MQACTPFKRLFDIVASLALILLLAIPLLALALLIRLTSPGAALHWSQRAGQNNRIFLMPKFRSERRLAKP
ncbi:hypothetical protein FACS189441_0370 [Betaproteobacteria bacterium]|nr:hypothetical protein FACS189441_0370 [Betaproteobacteria bacterium]